jgi:hypothetical protein
MGCSLSLTPPHSKWASVLLLLLLESSSFKLMMFNDSGTVYLITSRAWRKLQEVVGHPNLWFMTTISYAILNCSQTGSNWRCTIELWHRKSGRDIALLSQGFLQPT